MPISGGSKPPTDQQSRPSATRGLRPETVAIAAGRPDTPGGPLNTPLMPASNYRHGAEREYSRGEPTDTIADLERAVGALEGGLAVAFSSGMAAVSAIVDDLKRGARVLAPKDCYQGLAMALERGATRYGWKIEWIDVVDTQTWVKKIASRPDLVWVESPSNPLLEVGDVPRICEIAADALVPCAVDNTFATPLLQNPLELGATWSVHSMTKFIGGHSDLLGGIVVTTDSERREALVERQVLGGAILGSMDAFLALRGLRTLPVRLARAQASAGDLAKRLAEHPSITRVRFPGLPDDPNHKRAARTLRGPGAVLSFETTGDGQRLDQALSGLRVISRATSLGGVESTIERRARLRGQEHLPETLVRLSVGCEHPLDLWEDLHEAIDRLPHKVVDDTE